MIMESQNKASFGVIEGAENQRRETVKFHELLLRFSALLLTLAAAVILGVDKQTKTVPVQLTSTLPPLYIPVTAKWHYLSALVYFMVTNAIACSYAAMSMLLLAVSKGRSRSLMRSMIIVMDILMVPLLFSGFGAAAAVGVIGHQGNSHVRWNKICNVFGRFCSQGAASFLLSLVGATAFLLLAVLTALKLERKSK